MLHVRWFMNWCMMYDITCNMLNVNVWILVDVWHWSLMNHWIMIDVRSINLRCIDVFPIWYFRIHDDTCYHINVRWSHHDVDPIPKHRFGPYMSMRKDMRHSLEVVCLRLIFYSMHTLGSEVTVVPTWPHFWWSLLCHGSHRFQQRAVLAFPFPINIGDHHPDSGRIESICQSR